VRLDVGSAFLFSFEDDILNDLDDSVVGELLLLLIHYFETLLNQLVLDKALLVVQVLIYLIVDLY